MNRRNVFFAALAFAALTGSLFAQPNATVSSSDQLLRAVKAARPGVTIRLQPGQYKGGLTFSNLRGTKDKPIRLVAADTKRPPLFRGGSSGLHLINGAHLVLDGLVVEDARDNGINIDDSGSMKFSSTHITLRNLHVRNVGPTGNHDGIKLSGLKHVVVEQCTLETWGSGGSGIDMVGCHQVKIDRCTFTHSDTGASSGIQAKGGTADVKITRCRFEHAGRRAINLGGSTGFPYFRPPLKDKANVEAERLEVAGCTFIGSVAPIAYVTSRDCDVHHNTIYRPARWVFRILQEQPLDRFLPCQRGTFAHNLVVWKKGDLHRFVNFGDNTLNHTFTITGNWWYCLDDPRNSKPQLPVAEKGGVSGANPMLVNPEEGDLTVKPNSRAKRIGAHAYTDQ